MLVKNSEELDNTKKVNDDDDLPGVNEIKNSLSITEWQTFLSRAEDTY